MCGGLTYAIEGVSGYDPVLARYRLNVLHWEDPRRDPVQERARHVVKHAELQQRWYKAASVEGLQGELHHGEVPVGVGTTGVAARGCCKMRGVRGEVYVSRALSHQAASSSTMAPPDGVLWGCRSVAAAAGAELRGRIECMGCADTEANVSGEQRLQRQCACVLDGAVSNVSREHTCEVNEGPESGAAEIGGRYWLLAMVWDKDLE